MCLMSFLSTNIPAQNVQKESDCIAQKYDSLTLSINKVDASKAPVAQFYPNTVNQGDVAFLKIKSHKKLQKPYFTISPDSNPAKIPIYKTNDSIYSGYMGTTPNTKSGAYQVIIRDEATNFSDTIKLWVKSKIFGKAKLTTSPAVSKLTATPEENKIIGAALRTKSDTMYFSRPPFQTPVKGLYRTPYGKQRIENGVLKPDYFHKGIDISAPAGTPVLPTQSGKVLVARPDFKLNGGTVIIDHGHGLTSAYLHLSAVNVKEGQIVGLKDVIGKVGSTGHSSGPHLHFGLYMNGQAINPVGDWLNSISLKKPTVKIPTQATKQGVKNAVNSAIKNAAKSL